MTVSSVVRDSTGYVWLGTGLGVDRFDGVRVKHYPIQGSDAKYRRVSALTAHPSGDIYAGNGDGLWVLRTGSDAFVPAVADSARASVVGTVNALHITRAGHVLAGTGNGLYDFDPATGRPERVPLVDSRLAAPSNRVTDMVVDGDTLYLATDAGLVVLTASAPVLYSYPQPFNSIAIAGNRIFLGTDNHGVVAFDRKSGRMERYGIAAGDVVTDLAVDSRGRLYVATDGEGVTVIDARTDAVVDRYVHRAGRDGGLSSNAVYAVYVDADDLLWVGYYQLGASYTLYSAGLFSLYAEEGFSTAGRAVRVVKRNGRYTLVGTRDGVEIIDKSDDGTVRISHYEMPRLRSNMVISAAMYRNRFVVGTYGGGMQIIDPVRGTVEDFAVPGMDNPFRRGHVFCLTPHPDGSLWAGTSAGLFRFEDGAETRRWTSDNSQLPPGNIYAIFFDSKGNGWVCTENGMAVFDPERGNITGSVFPKGFFNGLKFKEVYEDSRGRLYFLPEHGDIYVSNTAMTEFGVLDTPQAANLEPRAIIEDSDGCMWLATSSGIFSRPAGQKEWIEYGSTDGVVSPLFINCTPALDASGRLWFGNSRGLLTVYPHDVDRRAGDGGFSLTLNEVLVNGMPLRADLTRRTDTGYTIDFPRHAGSIMLRLSPLNFADPQNMHYQYMLEGEDDGGWRDLDHTFDLSFYDMPGGTHRLLLRQAGRPDTEVCIELEVPFPMWLWVCVLAALVAVCTTVAYIYAQG